MKRALGLFLDIALVAMDAGLEAVAYGMRAWRARSVAGEVARRADATRATPNADRQAVAEIVASRIAAVDEERKTTAARPSTTALLVDELVEPRPVPPQERARIESAYTSRVGVLYARGYPSAEAALTRALHEALDGWSRTLDAYEQSRPRGKTTEEELEQMRSASAIRDYIAYLAMLLPPPGRGGA